MGMTSKSDHYFLMRCLNFFERCKSHGPTIIGGDFNARLHKFEAIDSDIMGPYVFGNQHADICDTILNRNLLIEFCRKANLLIVNIFLSKVQAIKWRTSNYYLTKI